MFSISAVADCHKLSDLKQHQFIGLQFFLSEVQPGSYRVN